MPTPTRDLLFLLAYLILLLAAVQVAAPTIADGIASARASRTHAEAHY
jgi:hypothetical protein